MQTNAARAGKSIGGARTPRVLLLAQLAFPCGREVRLTKFARVLERKGCGVLIGAPEMSDEYSGEDLRTMETFLCPQPGRASLKSNWPLLPGSVLWLRRLAALHRVNCIAAFSLKTASLASVFHQRYHIWYDAAEDNVEMVYMAGRGIRQHLRASVVRAFERFCLPRCHLITTESEFNRRRILRVAGRGKSVAVVENFADTDWSGASFECMKPLRFVYAGVLSEGRGLAALVEAFSLVAAHDRTIELRIIGDGPSRQMLELLAGRLLESGQIVFLGWRDRVSVGKELGGCHVGVIPFPPTPKTVNTNPNKLFEYMLAGLPVLSTPMPACEAVIKREDCGWIVEPEVRAMAQAIHQVGRLDAGVLRVLGSRGRAAVLREYNWDSASRRLVESLAHELSHGQQSVNET